MDQTGLRLLALNQLEALGEAAQTGRRALAAGFDHALIGGAREGEQAAAGNRAQHHGTDDGAALPRDLAHVEHVVLAAVAAHQRQQRRVVGAAVAELHALLRGQGAVAGGDDQRALDRAHAVADLARGLQQFGRNDGIEAAGRRVEAEHRAAAAQFGHRYRKHFDVIGGGAGALGHAGNGGALRRVAAGTRNVDQPFGEHAAAFAAEGADQQGDGFLLVSVHCEVMFCRRAVPRQNAAPSGGSAAHGVASVGAISMRVAAHGRRRRAEC